MSDLWTKLNHKGQDPILLLNAPEGFTTPAGVTVIREAGAADFALAFAQTQAQVDAYSRQLAEGVAGDGVLWIAYPKGTSKRYRCEFHRDTGWSELGRLGFEAVRQVAIDEDWSALRFRRTEFIKTLRRSPQRANSEAGKARTA